MRGLMRHPRAVIAALAVLAAVAIGWWLLARDPAPALVTGELVRTTLIEEVSAVGTVTPMGEVEVGSQVSGQIAEVLADFNDSVAAGQVIARLDPASFQARVAQAEARLATAQANLAVRRAAQAQAEAEARAAAAAVREAEADLLRRRDLHERGTIADAQLEAAIAATERARAQAEAGEALIASAQAQIAAAEADIRQAEASLADARVDLERTEIAAPVAGLVIDRLVDPGQTVAASLQTPVLFRIARDLARMRIEVDVDEADIGRVVAGQAARFTVDAWPARVFTGTVRQVRKAPKVTQSVVTYTVIVEADNPEGRLLPGMTAEVAIEIARAVDVLAAPSAALRYAPAGAERGPPALWLPGAGAPRRVPVEPGLSDGRLTQIAGPGLDAGTIVIIGGGGEEMGRPGFRPGGPRGLRRL